MRTKKRCHNVTLVTVSGHWNNVKSMYLESSFSTRTLLLAFKAINLLNRKTRVSALPARDKIANRVEKKIYQIGAVQIVVEATNHRHPLSCRDRVVTDCIN